MKKLYVRQKQVVSTLVLVYFRKPGFWHTLQTNCIIFQTIDPDICVEKCLGVATLPHFVHDFSSKIFLLNWPNFIVWLPLLLGILVIDTIYFETNHSFLINPFSYMTTKVRAKYLKNLSYQVYRRWYGISPKNCPRLLFNFKILLC